MAQLKLTLLGGFEAASSSGAVVALPTKKARALLAYCALRPGEAQQREKIANLLWGDTREENARNSLRQALFLLRAALKQHRSGALRIDNDTVTAEAQGIDVDVLRFEGLALKQTPAALEQAAALYRGDLLDGFVVDEEPFEQWLVQERERLRELALDCLARLLRHQSALETVDAAINTARRLLSLDPLQEAVHRVLMRLHARNGRREAALRQYEVCVGVLRRELQLGPEPETQQLHEEILKMRETAHARREEPPPQSERRMRLIEPPVHLDERRPLEIKKVAAHADDTEKADGAAAQVSPRRVVPISSAFWSVYMAKAAQISQACDRARKIRQESEECLARSREAVAATRRLSLEALMTVEQLNRVLEQRQRSGASDIGDEGQALQSAR
jgi:DNA-binding SARP family transcriptional activator